MGCILADGTRCESKGLLNYISNSWNFPGILSLEVLEGGAFPFILGLDFMRGTKMLVDVAARQFSFGFAPIVPVNSETPVGRQGKIHIYGV